LGRILAIDYGRARIGAAYSDERKIIATPLATFTYKNKLQMVLKEIEKSIEKIRPIELLVVGLPLLLTGQEGEMAKEAKAFGEALASFLSIPVLFWDERLSSCQAERMMKDDLLSRKQRASKVDTLAAILILQNYLDFLSTQKNKL
jgi:putative Holliday junction resolvase